MKIGVLGGTFDPVHKGHIMVAEEARDNLSLSRLLMVPAGLPRFKADERITPAEHRLAMLRLAVEGRHHLEVSTIELDRKGPSYTVDTIADLRKQYKDDDDIYFIMGWDSLEQFPEWREPERIISMCDLVAVPRPGWSRPDVQALGEKVPGISSRVIFLDNPQVDISASVIREMVAKGESIDRIVPEPVVDYIEEHKLYMKEQEA